MSYATKGRSQLVFNADIRRFGRPFLGGFGIYRVTGKSNRFVAKIGSGRYESPVIVGISLESFPDFPIAEISLGFQRGRITIESVKGEYGEQAALRDFSGGAGRPWPNYLVQKTMAVARRMGYSSIALRDVETLHFYKEPFLYQYSTNGVPVEQYPALRQKIRAQMKKFYNSFRRKMGFRTREGDYWVRPLRQAPPIAKRS